MSQKSRSVEAVNTSSPAAEAQQKSSGISRPAVDPFQLKKSLPFSASAYAPGAGVVQRNSFEDYDTYEEAKDSFTAREIDRVRVKGKYEPVRIFELVCEGEPTDKVAETLKLFAQGYELYHQKKFSEAQDLFKKAFAVSQKDPVSELYIERCQDYLDSAPPEDWDGVFVMKTK